MASRMPFIKKWRKQPLAMYRCDACFSEIYEGHQRYCCMECVKSYDLCSKCCKAGKDREHTQLLGSEHQFIEEQRSDKATTDLVRSTTLEGTIRNWFLYYAKRHALGSYNSATNTYHYLTYEEVGQLVRDFASGVKYLMVETIDGELMGKGGGRRKKDRGAIVKGKIVSVCGPACLEWYVADFAFLLLGMINAPITVTADRETINSGLQFVEAEVVACAPQVVDTILSITTATKSNVHTIIVMDKTTPTHSSGGSRVRVVRFSEVLAIGNEHPISNSKWNHSSHNADDIFTIVFTSGSTGQPKGCVFSRGTWYQRMTHNLNTVGRKRVWLSYHPPSHNLDRSSVYNTLCVGGKVAFYRGSMEHLLDDYALVRPTIISSTPRFWNIIYNKYLQALQVAYHEYLMKEPQQEQEKHTEREVIYEQVMSEGKMDGVMEDEGDSTEKDMKQDLNQKSQGATGKGTAKKGDIPESSDNGLSMQLRPQLSHLSSFDGEDTDKLDEELQLLDVSTDDRILPLPSYTTDINDTSSEGCAVASEMRSYPDEVFDIDKVPHEVKSSVMEQFKSILGGREIAVVTGGAPTSEAVKKFILTCFGGIPSEGYGATEVGGIASNGTIHTRNEFKLLDVPEMGYLTSDKPPRGELCVKTPTMVTGYYKNEQEMRDKFVDGYFRTGDIVVLEGKDKVRIIDRKKNIFKLAQGEFVSPERLEAIYTVGSSKINQMYIYGNSLQSNIVAVVVPHSDSLQKWWADNNQHPQDISLPCEDLCQMSEMEDLYMAELISIAASQGLQGWEVPAGILLEPVPFTAENGLLTAIQKKSRPRLERKYGSALEELYARINTNQGMRPLELRIINFLQHRTTCSDTMEDKATLASGDLSAYDNSTITQLGGDSLTAMRLSGLLKEHMSIDVSAQAILTYSLRQLLEIVSPQHKSSEYQHERRGQGSGSIDWDAESSLEFLQKYSDRKGRNPLRNESEMTVLLTGATGFLGRFVLLSLLQSTTVEKVYCTVKSESNIVPSKRVADILSQLCNELSLDNTFQNKLEVMEGDLTLERLGLTEPNYTALCSHVDVVIHNGAVVNAALPYASLKGANVDGTKEVLKIVCEGRPKFLHYVSSMGVFSGQSSEEMITEDTLPNKERLSRLSGYSQSKWVGETIVLKAMKQKLIQASVSRPGLIGAHSSTGHANLQDWLCWLVRGLARLGSCPVGPGCDDRVFYCVPVDQVAKAIVFFSLTYQGFDSVFHLVNNSSPLRYSALGDTVKTLLCPSLTTCDYAEFRSRLSVLARSGDNVLSSLDLLLPRAGGWANSQSHSNTATQLICDRAGIKLDCIPDDYLEKYIHFIASATHEP